ncbi:MAG: (4Fe-4S)-binding protein [Lentisphaeria bacterium]|jgi:ferredoxin|nr:(4Fe-4S)-binding protein [Lentisphaeria bacterium]
MLTAEQVKEYALRCGADKVGIGSMDRFEGAPKNFDPRYIMPRAKSIIGMAIRVHRGLLRGIEEGTYFAGYPSMGYANINDVYAPMVVRELASFLEDEGYEALPYINGSVRYGANRGVPVEEGKPAPDVFLHFRIAGVICGLGEIGYSKVFLTKEFGPCQRLVFVLTEAELEPDPVVTGEICDKCMACVRECPAHAISATEQQHACVAGHDISWGDLDCHKCSAVYQAGTKEISPFMPEEIKGYIDKIISEEWKQGGTDMVDYSKYKNVWGYLRQNFPYITAGWESFHHPAALCGAKGCVRACLDHLDKKGVLSHKFKHPFRDRKPWKIQPPAAESGE